MPKLKLFIPAFLWFLLILVLLTLPGYDIPKADFLDEIYFDKWVHTGLFGMQVVLACFPFFRSKYASAGLYFKITLGAILYGIAMEYVQKYFTIERSFDVWDMTADAFGSILGCIWIFIRYKRFLRKQHEVV